MDQLSLFLIPIFCTVIAFSFIPLCMYVIFPFFHSLSQEQRFEKYINNQCLQGNEIAILIRREGIRYYNEKDYQLIRAAIQGNVHAIKALKLDKETQTSASCKY